MTRSTSGQIYRTRRVRRTSPLRCEGVRVLRVAVLLCTALCLQLAADFPSNRLRAASTEASKEERQRKSAADFFNGPIVTLAIEMAPEELQKLKRDQRNYAEAIIKEDDARIYKGVAVKLKGAAGSFQGVDAKPGMTVSLDKFKDAERFHGMKKFHLNNGAQDGSYLNELIAGEIGRAAGVPASRCTHVFVTLNGRDLGLYVFKEAFTRDFLAPFFEDTGGDLWDGGFCKEVEENMEKDLGDPNDKRDIKELIAACREADNAKRWERLGKILDIDRFVSFCAMEAILCHWDGYNFNHNNYRLYKDPSTGKISFFLHGMDQMFGDPNFPLMRDFGTLVGGAVMRCPEGRRIYQARLETIYANILKSTDWAARVVEAGSKVRLALEKKNKHWAKDYQGQINATRDRVTARIAVVGRQLGDMPKPAEFDKSGILKLVKGWREQTDGNGRIDQTNADGKACLHIVAQGAGANSWRKSARLPAGKYRFEALARTAGVAGLDGASGRGAGLRISGARRGSGLEADSGWKQISYEFQTVDADVVLVAELRATRGEVWFVSDSLQLVKLK